MPNPKMIPDPDDETKQIPNPDYNPELNEDGTPIETPKPQLSAEVQALIDAAVETVKSDFKEKMNNLDSKYKDANVRLAEYDRKEREAETQKLKDEGKLEEAHKRELEDRDSKLVAAERRITELTRDIEVNTALGGFDFKNTRAAEVARRDITDQLVKNDDGIWTHKDGSTSVTDFVKAYLEHEDNSFLLKPRQSSGLGSASVKPSDVKSDAKSVFGMDVADVMKLAAAGKLPHQQNR
jgi:hypothetical protein